jgi:hypothetical protein
MPRGGKREGAGRKAGAVTTRTREIADKAATEGLTPLEYMLQMLRDESASKDDRMWAAEKAAPFVHPKLAAVDHSGELKHSADDSIAGLLGRIANQGLRLVPDMENDNAE